MTKQWSDLWLHHAAADKSDTLHDVFLEGFDAQSPIVANALRELSRAVGSSRIKLHITRDTKLPREGFGLDVGTSALTLAAADENGLLYAAFHLRRHIALGRTLDGLSVNEAPAIGLRMLNHWDSMDGHIERGYSGRSFFFRDGQILLNERTADYARLVASVGINGVVINNVNVRAAATRLITAEYLGEVAKMAALFAAYGIRLYLAINFAAPLELGGPDSADPLDERVAEWWQKQIAAVYAAVPTLGGFLVKADSEGRPGPFSYGRTQADGANMLARLTAPYGGVILWRCFVYNCTQNWRDEKTDRARAGYDNFIDTDGDYLDNVILQIKNGPMDFQIREPVSPLFGGMTKTNQMLELQLAQEYTGQQIDLCYLIPMYKEVLDFDAIGVDNVFDIISGRTFARPHSGIVAVANTGDDANWTGHDLAAANLYGFGRLAWSPQLSAEEIAEEWIRLSLSADDEVVAVVKDILLKSRQTYEKYTTPLGIGWMVTPHSHYGPAVDGYEYSRWGTYHRADRLAIGVDRSSRGTDFISQYHEPHASIYNEIATCPEELLLFFHRVPYDHVMKNGKTLLRHFYDLHIEGVKEVEAMIAAWAGLAGKLDPGVHAAVGGRLTRQLQNAIEWRDQVNTYFYRKTGVEV